MNTGEAPSDFWARVAWHFAKPESIQPVQLQDETGHIIGGVLFIRGQREFELVCSLFPQRVEPQLPVAERTG